MLGLPPHPTIPFECAKQDEKQKGRVLAFEKGRRGEKEKRENDKQNPPL